MQLPALSNWDTLPIWATCIVTLVGAGYEMANEKESGGDSSIGDIAKVVAGLAKEVPIYGDLVQPAAKELGKTFHTVARVVNVLAVPLHFTVWSADQIEKFVRDRVLNKLQHTPDEALQSPPLHVGVPILEALRYIGTDPELSELYANLLANSMDTNTMSGAHPGFVDVIRNMTSDEAKLMRYFVDQLTAPLLDVQLIRKKRLFRPTEFQTVWTNCSVIGYKAQCVNPELSRSYIANLVRLGLLEIDRQQHMSDQSLYDEILASPLVVGAKKYSKENNIGLNFTKYLVRVSEFGRLFIKTCVSDKAKSG
jgi:Abortive infection alpha